MKMTDFSNKKMGILGFGIENQALLKWLIRHKANNISIYDQNPNVKAQISNQIQMSKLKFQLGKGYLKNLEKFDVVFRTPGLSPLSKELIRAKKKGVQVSSQTKLFFDLCPAKIIGITGTKGKGTTTALIYEILKTSVYHLASSVYLAGNIGNPPIEFLDKLTKDDIVVLELSSFQLQDLEKSPHIAVVLDIKVDHLDYHRDRKEYVGAKTNIVKHQTKKDFTVINLDYLTSFKFAALSPTSNDYYFSRKKSVDLGTYVEWLPRGRGAHFGKIILRTDKKDYEICKTYDITLRGEHNLENICAAITASYLAGASIKAISDNVTRFRGLEHRLEYVASVKGVKYYNDSFSTTPETAIAAIKSFSEPIILIAGGSEKGADYGKLGRAISQSSVKTLIAIGQTGSRIADEVARQSQKDVRSIEAPQGLSMALAIHFLRHDSQLKNKQNKIKIISGLKNMQSMVKTAVKQAKPGDVVLLSPASASFDMFENYKDRGNQFKKEVDQI